MGRIKQCGGETTPLMFTGPIHGGKAFTFRLVRVEVYRGFVSWQVSIRCSTDHGHGKQGYSHTGQAHGQVYVCKAGPAQWLMGHGVNHGSYHGVWNASRHSISDFCFYPMQYT